MPPKLPASILCELIPRQQPPHPLPPTSLRNASLLLLRPPPRNRHHSTQPPPNPHHSSSSSSSVSASELAHFNALALTWWDPHGSSRLLHLMNPLRHSFIRSCTATGPARRNVRYLDVGCGGGIFAESAARLPATAHVAAIDPSSEVIRIAEAHARQDPLLLQGAPGRLRYRNASIEQLPLPASEEGRYDVLTLFEVLEHVARPAPFLEACKPFVKLGGWIVLSTISRSWLSWFTTVFVAEEVVRLVPRGTHDWRKYVDVGEMRGFWEGQRGWGEARSEGVVYVPGVGWRVVPGSEGWGNYFFGVRRVG